MFSVIVPVYKAEKYLDECAASVLGQSFRDLELILVDDGSPDSSPEICDRLAKRDGRVRVIHKKNAGVAEARNDGCAAARGDHILFLDSDDYWCDGELLEKLHRVFRAEPEVDAIFLKDRHLTQEGALIDRYFPPADFNSLSPREFLGEIVRTDSFLGAPWNKAVKKSFLEKHHILFTTGLWAEDILYDAQFVYAMPCCRVLPDYSYVQRRTDGSRSTQANEEHLRQYLTILDRVTELADAGGETEEILRGYGAYHFMLFCSRVAGCDAVTRERFMPEILKRKAYLDCALNKKVRVAKISRHLLGMTLTVKLLGLYLKLR